MSGIYIHGMEMPREGDLIVIRPDGKAYYVSANPQNAYEREAVPVPPHGRLIDADAFEAEYWSAQFWGDRDAAKKVHRAPTIIPAEKCGVDWGD